MTPKKQNSVKKCLTLDLYLYSNSNFSCNNMAAAVHGKCSNIHFVHIPNIDVVGYDRLRLAFFFQFGAHLYIFRNRISIPYKDTLETHFFGRCVWNSVFRSLFHFFLLVFCLYFITPISNNEFDSHIVHVIQTVRYVSVLLTFKTNFQFSTDSCFTRFAAMFFALGKEIELRKLHKLERKSI